MYKGGFRIISEAGRQVVWLEFFGPYFAIWQGFGWLDESQVDWQETVLKRKFGECLLCIGFVRAKKKGTP
jgi:hypothetical protein